MICPGSEIVIVTSLASKSASVCHSVIERFRELHGVYGEETMKIVQRTCCKNMDFPTAVFEQPSFTFSAKIYNVIILILLIHILRAAELSTTSDLMGTRF